MRIFTQYKYNKYIWVITTYLWRKTEPLYYGSILANFEPSANRKIDNNPPFRPFFYFVRNSDPFWIDSFHGLSPPFWQQEKRGAHSVSKKCAIWLPKTGNAGKVINLNSRRIEYLKIKRTAFQISQGNSGAFLPLRRSSFQLRPSQSPLRPS